MHSQPASKYCELRQTEEKGLGVFAKIKIDRGKMISDEVAILIRTKNFGFSAATWENPEFWEDFRAHGTKSVERQVSDQLAYYKDDAFQQDAFARLSRSLPGDLGLSDKANVTFANCLPSNNTEPPFAVVFGPTSCAFNHSCVANAGLTKSAMADDPTKLRVRVIAMQPIEAGTEITVPYMILSLPTPERRLQLREKFRFDCLCDVCKDENSETANRYANLNRLLQQLAAPPEHEIKSKTPWLFFKAAVDLGQLYEDLGIDDIRIPTLWQNCASVAAYHSDGIRTHFFFVWAAQCQSILSINDVTNFYQLSNNPEEHPQWGHTKMGLSDVKYKDLFRATNDNFRRRVMMADHNEDSYDRILPNAEAAKKRQEGEKAMLAEKAKLAEEAARELLAEKEKGEASVAPLAKKAKKKKKAMKGKGKGKKEGVGEGGEGVEEEGEAVGSAPAIPEVRLNTAQEGEDDVGGWQEVGKGGSQQRAQAVPVAAEPVVGVAGGEAEGTEEGEEGGKGEEEVKEAQRPGTPGFSVAEAALAGERGTLARLRGNSEPPPFSPLARYDEGLVLPRGGREFSRRCEEYWALPLGAMKL